tara:strand:- start:1255 stop:1986 length:732 start_codon:yes stop_codon:yes gene_type:complete
MNKRFIFTLFFSYIFSQSSIDTLSVTIYPEYYYQGVMVEYRFDKYSTEKYTFNLSTEVDSVLYLVSKGDEFFEEVVKVDNKSISSIEKLGEHKIYLFLDKYNQLPGLRDFSYQFNILSDIQTLIMAFQFPFASENFIPNANNIPLEEVGDQNGLTFLQGILNNYKSDELIDISFSYFNPHGLTSIQYSANISADNAPQNISTPTSRDKFVTYPFLTWEPMLIFLILTLILVFLYGNSQRKNNS